MEEQLINMGKRFERIEKELNAWKHYTRRVIVFVVLVIVGSLVYACMLGKDKISAQRFTVVDELGNLRDAISAAAKLAGIEGEPKIIYPEEEKRSVVDYLFDRVTEQLADNLQEYMGLLLVPPLPGEPNLS